jgi:glycine cleavage system regulatory protein
MRIAMDVPATSDVSLLRVQLEQIASELHIDLGIEPHED